MSIYAMEKALKALEEIYAGCGYFIEEKFHEDAMDLAGFVRKDCIEPIKVLTQAIQQQTDGKWVGLTDEEIRDSWSWSATAEAERTATTQQHAFARAVEAKLKEKNT